MAMRRFPIWPRTTVPARLCRPDLRKASGFPPSSSRLPPSAQAGRLSLPAWAEDGLVDAWRSERRSLSASQSAEPQAPINKDKCSFDKPAWPCAATLGKEKG